MPNPSREIVLFPTTTVTSTATGTGADINIPEQYTAAIIRATVGTVTGTSPTCDVKIQHKIPTAASTDTASSIPSGTAVYHDFAAFAQITASSADRVICVVGSGNVESARTDGTLAAATIRNGPIGRTWRVKAVIGGTSPSFPLTVVAQLIP